MHRHLSAPILQCTAALCEAQSPRTAKHSSVLMTRTPAAVHSKQCQQQSECGRRSHEERLWHGRSCARYCHHHALSCQVVIAVVRVVAAVADDILVAEVCGHVVDALVLQETIHGLGCFHTEGLRCLSTVAPIASQTVELFNTHVEEALQAHIPMRMILMVIMLTGELPPAAAAAAEQHPPVIMVIMVILVCMILMVIMPACF
mmetsp:Transcript_20298/g.56567  ORF Transcript_20298/g.56567 Transcript_20298/m.56567 type:complete len:203 (-) Transcript_20298:387-995(-)